MYLSKISIQNYRNLDGIEITFDGSVNFIVGENNLGKSNFLELLNTIFSRSSFSESDFKDPESQISVDVTIYLPDSEIGYFGELFDPENKNFIHITVCQETPDDPLRFFHKETGTYISSAQIRGANYIRYDSFRNPLSELNFEKNRGVGKFLNHLSKRFFEEKKLEHFDCVDASKLNDLLAYINSSLKHIKAFKEFGIGAAVEDDVENLIAKLIVLRDANSFTLKAIGFGVQFLVMFPLLIFERLISSAKKTTPNIFKTEDGSHISVILGLDEPEIHLHPYMQRSLVKYLHRITTDKEEEFKTLLKNVFDIDCLMGQMIMVTHSPSIILDDYSQIVRFHTDGKGALSVVSGFSLTLDPQAKKHLHRNFHYVKEAFFSRCVILVEGDTERGALPGFSSSIKIAGKAIDLDELGISIIQAAGANSIPPIMKMLRNFGIKCVGVIDRDKYDSEPKKFEGTSDLFVTKKLDFEEELVMHVESKNFECLYTVLTEYDSKGMERCMFKNPVNNARLRYGINVAEDFEISADKIETDDDYLAFFLSWLSVNKSISLGLVLGENLAEQDIPTVYKDALTRAVELAK